MSSKGRTRRLEWIAGEAQLPADFGERLTVLKRRSGLT